MTSAPRYLVVGQIVAPFGVKGEVKANVWTDFPERLAARSTVFVGKGDEEPRQITLRGVRFHQKQALLTFAGCTDRDAAEQLRGLLVQIPSADAPALPPGSYYVYQIIGLRVWGTDGRDYGTITEMITTPGNDVYKVDGAHGEILVPATPAYVHKVDLEHERMIVETSGLL